VRAERKQTQLLGFIGLDRQHDNWDLRPSPRPLNNFSSVGIGRIPIENDQVGRLSVAALI